ncbi:MAG: amidase [Rhodobacteraceae bacterium]|nr:amidase [Paracoccaceae bacterium]
MTTPLWTLTATELARRTRNGEVSALEAVEAAIARMDAANPKLNAVVDDLRDEARARAAALDRARAAGEAPGPLHGVPVTIKVNIDQKGHATTNGMLSLRDAIAPDDAPVVSNLLKAGAVVIGRSATPELSFRAETDSPLYGPTHNPWGRHISAGGSSGGAGSAVMAGIGALGHGNDIGGSLRFPAAATGAVTVKPGLGRVPAFNPGQVAERGPLAQAMSVQGVLARSAADLALAMPALVAPDPRDPFHVPLPYKGAAPSGPLRVAFCRETFGFALHPAVATALDTAARALERAGYLLEEIAPPHLEETALTGYRALLGEVKLMMGPDIATHGSNTLQAIFAEYFRQFPPLEGLELVQAMARRTYFAREWALFQQEYPLVLCPFLPHPTYRPGRDLEGPEGVREVLGAAFWSYAMNFLGLPAGVVPALLAQLPDGPAPVAVQVVGPRWREDLVVQALAAIEDEAGPMAPRLWAHRGEV